MSDQVPPPPPPPLAVTRLRDAAFGWPSALALLIGGIVLGMIVGAALMVLCDEHRGHHRYDRPWIYQPQPQLYPYPCYAPAASDIACGPGMMEGTPGAPPSGGPVMPGAPKSAG